MGMLGRWGAFVARHARTVLVVGAVATVGLYTIATVGVDGTGLFARVETGPPSVAGSDSDTVRQVQSSLVSETERNRLAVYVRDVDLASADVRKAFADAASQIAGQRHVTTVTTAFGVWLGPRGEPADLGNTAFVPPIDRFGTGFLMTVEYDTAVPDVLAAHHQAIAVVDSAMAEVAPTQPDGTALAFSSALLYDDFTDQMERDLITGELIALPAALIVMVLVFGGFLAAATPITGAIASIAGGLGILYGMSHLMDIDQSAVNVVTVLGIGLSIDYGLLIVSRYREELARHGGRGTPGEVYAIRGPALSAALATAGRTVIISAVIVGASVGGMLLFTPQIMRAFGAAGLGVVITASVAALTVVPAVAYLWAPRLARPSVIAGVPLLRRVLAATSDVTRDEGAFSRLAEWTQRRPWWVLGGTTALLVLLALPLGHLELRNSELETLPVDNERRVYVDAVYDAFPFLAPPDAVILASALPADLDAWLGEVTALDGVDRVSPAYEQGHFTFADVFLASADPGSAEAVGVVREIRALDSPFRVRVGGKAAIQIDFTDAIRDGALVAGGLIVLVTFVLLFLMTGSLLVPLKTLLINSLSLAAALGFVVWAFQDGHLEGLLGFQSVGGIETYVAVLIVAFGFGLAMDYEVFLLARVKEYIDAGLSNDAAVRAGLQRSGRIITSAAAIVILVFLGFAFGQLLMIKEVGVGLAFAVLLDASIVRMLLVPATMTLLGRWNWWAPAPLARLHRRWGVTH